MFTACTSLWTMTSGQPYLAVAHGWQTDAMLWNSSGTILTTSTEYYTESIVATGYITVSTTIAQVNQPFLQVAVPTQSVPDWKAPTSTSTPQYTVFGLPFVYSILATVGMGVGGLALLCICCCCVRSCSSSSSGSIRLPPPVTATGTYPGFGTIPTTTTSTYVANCGHGRSSLCSYRLSYESTCCACKDSRTASPSLTVQSRTTTYCPPCMRHWRSRPSSQIPVEWRPAANVEDLIDQIIEERKCVHGIVGAACSRCHPGSKKCCACVDPRVGQLISQETRAASYCETCRDFFRDCTPAECPAEWRLSDLQCEHSRSKACSQAKEYELTCCACKDTRRGAMPRHDRTATYCVSCSSYFNALAVSLLPQSWGIKCDHGDLYTRCSTHNRTGQCCACLDNRSGPPGFNKQVRTSTYCSPCSAHWKNTDDSLCPRFWNLKCPHGRANAWEKGMRYTSGPCCCACKDANKAMVPKATRLRGYCANCRSLWNATPDAECPAEWQLGCRHNGMAAKCLNSGPTRTKCCACNDRRTKNLPKASRVRNYCATCESAWKAKPDSQCPPEWRLMEPRNDCKHSMALECGNAPEGDAKCCACRDGRKFVGLTTRLASYCQHCRSVWQQATSKAPAGWSVSEKDIPTRYCREGCLPRRPVATYKRENQDKYCRQFDEGPRYGAPRYGRKEGTVVAHTPLASNNPSQRQSQAMSKLSSSMVAISQYTTQATISPLQSPREPNYQGYQEKGPQRNGPRFTVAPDTTVPQPTPLSPQNPMDEKRLSAFTEPPKKKCEFRTVTITFPTYSCAI